MGPLISGKNQVGEPRLPVFFDIPGGHVDHSKRWSQESGFTKMYLYVPFFLGALKHHLFL